MPIVDEDDSLAHYGVKRRSGRYPWGSGGTDLSEAKDFKSALQALRARTGPDKMTEAEIAKVFGLTTSELRANIAISGILVKQNQINQAKTLKEAGLSTSAIAREMFGSSSKESTVRDLLSDTAMRKQDKLEQVANFLKQRVEEDGYIDVGKGAELYLGAGGINKTTKDTILAMLRTEGYAVESVNQPQLTGANETRVLVLAKPGETWSSINNNRDKIKSAQIFTNDRGETFQLVQEPLKLNPARLDIVYKEQGGGERDGIIFIRPGVDDLTLKGATYAQVRIQVGDGHYIKGMAVQKNGLPPGVDVQFHTNKSDTGKKMDALKEVKPNTEPLERFGSLYTQITDERTGKVKSHLNIVNDEEDWERWSKSLATQMLSKQKPDFVKKQLDATYAQKKAQLEEIMALTNPVVKKKMLADYAEDMDASSVHLKAASLPRQKTHVLIAVKSLKDHEVYAPGYEDGERVVLIRYPHGGKFEIPELVVNNRNREANEILPKATTRSAIGINSKVAEQLSGADFDGDTVVLIPNRRGKIQTESPLKQLRGFNPQEQYRGVDPKTKKPYPGVKLMTNTQTEMGKISNLITDMTIGGATHEELARAVRHSMVVIDAEKHGLDYTRSKKENTIKALEQKYQPGLRSGGASTIISRTKGNVTVPDFKRRTQAQGGGTDPRTGEAIYVPTEKLRPKKIKDPVTGEEIWVKVPKTIKVPAGSRPPGGYLIDRSTGERVPIRDAYDLVSGPRNVPSSMRGTTVERHYAEYSNQVRSLANQARLAELNTPDPRVNRSASQTYAKEVASIKAKVKQATMNSPRERQAQVAASVIVKMKVEDNPHLKTDAGKADLKRVKTAALRTTRQRLGAKPQRVDFTEKEWEAVQNDALAASVLREVLAKADMDKVRKLATPDNKLLMQPHNVSLARSLMATGNYTRAEIAAQLGVSVSTLDRSLA